MAFLLSDLSGKEIIQIPFEDIIPNQYNPLNPLDEDNIGKTIALAIAILEEGLNNPLTGELMPDGKFRLNKGHSRRAAIELIRNNDQRVYSQVKIRYSSTRFDVVDCFNEVFSTISDSVLSLMRDNVLAKDITPKAMFKYILCYMENVLPNRRKEMPDYIGMPTRNMIARDLGIKSLTTVQQHMAIAKSYSFIQEAFLNDEINMATAYSLTQCTEETALEVLNKIKGKSSITSLDVKKIIKEKKSNSDKYKYAEELLREKFKTKAIIKKGNITIKFSDDNDLNRILELMKAIEEGEV